VRIIFFVHSVLSDWNHGNAHFLRGLMRALRSRGHDVLACERWRSWSVQNLYKDHGAAPILEKRFRVVTRQVAAPARAVCSSRSTVVWNASAPATPRARATGRTGCG
jgi:hypothetical protein